MKIEGKILSANKKRNQFKTIRYDSKAVVI